MHDDLCLAVSVAKINENQSTEIARARNPALKCDRLSRMFAAQLAASVCASCHDELPFANKTPPTKAVSVP